MKKTRQTVFFALIVGILVILVLVVAFRPILETDSTPLDIASLNLAPSVDPVCMTYTITTTQQAQTTAPLVDFQGLSDAACTVYALTDDFMGELCWEHNPCGFPKGSRAEGMCEYRGRHGDYETEPGLCGPGQDGFYCQCSITVTCECSCGSVSIERLIREATGGPLTGLPHARIIVTLNESGVEEVGIDPDITDPDVPPQEKPKLYNNEYPATSGYYAHSTTTIIYDGTTTSN